MSKHQLVDKKLYEEVKKRVYAANPQHSTYRSGFIVKMYKEEFAKKYGPNLSAYTNNKPINSGLPRWFNEEWTNQHGEIGYQKSGDVYRPSRRVTSDTPTTWSELSQNEIKKAQKEKKQTGRVKKFKQANSKKN